MTTDGQHTFTVQELPAPEGWTAALLAADLPVAADRLDAYRAAVNMLLDGIEASQDAALTEQEVFLLFQYCRPDREVEQLRDQARWWLPEFGVGVWLDRNPPTTWTVEEFEAAAPGKLRPVIDRVIRIKRERSAQRDAWRRVLGSGAAMRLTVKRPGNTVAAMTSVLQPCMVDRSLTSFPFYIPLLTRAALRERAFAFDQPWDDLLPGVHLYVRESVSDGGLLLLSRYPEHFWGRLKASPGQWIAHRLELPPGDPAFRR